MKIILDDTYFIDVTERNHTLMRRGINQNKEGDNYGKETLIAVGYYSDFPRAVIGYINNSDINEIDEINVRQYLDRYCDKCDKLVERLGGK